MKQFVRSHRRGLSLIEVLAATVLLAALAAACVPVLRSSLSVLHETGEEDFSVAELSALVDRLKAEPGEFDLTLEQITRPGGAYEIPWPDQPERPSIRATVATSEHPGVAHAWLTLSAVDRQDRTWSVSRMVKLPKEGAP